MCTAVNRLVNLQLDNIVGVRISDHNNCYERYYSHERSPGETKKSKDQVIGNVH